MLQRQNNKTGILTALMLCSGIALFSGMSLATEMTEQQGFTEAASAAGIAAALQATMQHNPALKGKQSVVEAQQYAVDSAKAKRYPTIRAQANNVNEQEQATITIDQPLWTFGKISTAIDQAQASVVSQEWELLEVQRQLIEETAIVYAKIDGIKLRLQVAQKNVAAHEGYHQRINRRQQGQLSSEADVRLAYARLLQAKTQRETVKGELSVALTELYTLTQIQVATDQSIELQLAELPALAEVERQAAMHQATVQLKRQALANVRLDLKAEELAVMPTLSLRVESDLIETVPGADDFRAGLSLESSLEGAGFVARSRMRGAEARIKAAKFELDSALNDVRRRVKTLMQNRKVKQGLVDSQQMTVDAMQQTQSSFLRQYETGRKSWLEVLNTQREVTSLEMGLVQAHSEWLSLSLRIAALTGRLDSLAGINTGSK
ncbi:TolC family protein [Psychrobium sp. 1_MG-2023]|uniref:TolC family protein n=1 Tax=Psychrobium sp. 1_MG-2023 TaxID=3062624 RepID=UPI000C344760|nr:TolC family protein [Psychrobium sp. 1_MG-2023]MDP2562561.1 TolC family protein [Psychrobium sp. 1_MG-2023]PKF54420.1 transporter [Alteromonadales bacterium alter-6D02]